MEAREDGPIESVRKGGCGSVSLRLDGCDHRGSQQPISEGCVARMLLDAAQLDA